MLTILHTADFHIKDSAADECARCLDVVIRTAETQRPDLIIIAGDLTHRYDTKLESRSARLVLDVVRRLSDVAPVVVVGGTPIHDGKSPEIIETLNRPNIVICSDYPRQFLLSEGRLLVIQDAYFQSGALPAEAVISVLPAPTKRFLDQLGTIRDGDATIADGIGAVLLGFRASATGWDDLPHIVAGHWSIGGAYISETQQMIGRDIEISRDQVELAKPDLVCLGHIHKRQQIGENIFYSGSLYSLDSGEMEPKGFYLHRLMQRPAPHSRSGLKSTFIEVPSTRRVKLAFDFVADPTGIDRLDELLWNRPADDLSGKVVHMAFRVFQDQACLLDKAKIEAWLVDDCLATGAKVEILRVPRENIRSARYFDLRTYKDKLIEQARLRDEPEALTPGILDKLDQLESLPPEDLIKHLSTL